jgi:hypothetical protein
VPGAVYNRTDALRELVLAGLDAAADSERASWAATELKKSRPRKR